MSGIIGTCSLYRGSPVNPWGMEDPARLSGEVFCLNGGVKELTR